MRYYVTTRKTADKWPGTRTHLAEADDTYSILTAAMDLVSELEEGVVIFDYQDRPVVQLDSSNYLETIDVQPPRLSSAAEGLMKLIKDHESKFGDPQFHHPLTWFWLDSTFSGHLFPAAQELIDAGLVEKYTLSSFGEVGLRMMAE